MPSHKGPAKELKTQKNFEKTWNFSDLEFLRQTEPIWVGSVQENSNSLEKFHRLGRKLFRLSVSKISTVGLKIFDCQSQNFRPRRRIPGHKTIFGLVDSLGSSHDGTHPAFGC